MAVTTATSGDPSPFQRALSPPRRLLMGPGPSNVHPRVYRALSTPLVGHLDPEFLALMNSIQDMLRTVFRTANRLTLSISGTGSAGMEAALVNVVEPGDAVLVGVNGVFGSRMADVAARAGAEVERLERPWGEVFSPEEVRAALDARPGIRIVCLVHAETSTGAHQPVAEIGRLCRERDKLLVLDTVTSLGGTEVKVDEWMVDVCYSGTQKCLSCPPGLAPITFSERAAAKARRRATPARSWYLDLNLIDSYWTEGNRAYHHTAPISMNYALHEALAVLLDAGLDPTFERHRVNSRALVAGLEALGFSMFVEASHRLPMLNSVVLPEGVPDADIRRRLLEEYNLEIGAGLGQFAGRIWRIGLMGESCRRENVLFFLGALEATLHEAGRLTEMGAGLQAAVDRYGSGGDASSGNSSR